MISTERFIPQLKSGIALLALSSISIVLPAFALPKVPTAKTLLWEISGNGLSQPSYLFGTIHRGCAKRLALSGKQKSAFELTKQLYLEIDLSINETGESYRLPVGKTIRDMMTPAQYQEVEDYFGKEVLESGLDKVRPSALALQVSNRLFQKHYKRICKDVASRESILMELARKRTAPIFALETSKDRNTIDSNYLAPQEEVLSLLSTISMANTAMRDPSVFSAVTKYHEIYFRQDIDAMDRLSPMDNNKKATIERNRLWIPKIRNAMKQKSTFFAVGAGHLGGEQGVISLLEKNGYTLRPIFDHDPQKAVVATDRNYAAITSRYLESAYQQAQDGDVLDAIEDYTKAIEILTKYEAGGSSIADIYLQRGALNRDNVGDFQGALYDFNKAIEVDSSNALHYLVRGRLKHEYLSDFQGALRDYDKAIALEPNYYSTYRARAALKNEKLTDFQGALADYNTVLAANPQENIGVMIDRGVLRYSKMNDRPGGIVDLRRAALLSRNKGNKEELLRVLSVLKAINVSEIP
jgi:uncharacterized protein